MSTLRAVIYARYSSDNQSEASIADQVRLCRELIARENWLLVDTFHDAAISGATAFRPGYQAMLNGAREGAFDVVVAEALDRLSRDQEDTAALYERLRFAGVRIITLAEGEISELHVGLKGTMNALFLKDLADKTRRGLRGRIEAGRSAGGRCYGYDVVRRLDERGKPLRGERAINPDEAVVVCRIFERFADGHSPIAIARQLNAERLPGPEGQAWRDTTIRGHAARGTGILRNELYIGRLVWNRMHFIKDPSSGRRVSRPNPREQWIVEEVPALRIVEQDLWDRVQKRLGDIREACGANSPDRPRYWEKRRAQHVLTGKVVCGRCGGPLSNVGRDYLACSAARRQGVCDNRASIRRQALEQQVLEALRTRLMAPELVAEFVAEFTREWNQLLQNRDAGRAQAERELAQVRRKLAGLIDAIADGLRASGLQKQLSDLEARQAALEAELGAPMPPQPRLHPNLAELYRTRVSELHASLRADPDGRESLEVVRSLIERVVVHPRGEWKSFEIELEGQIAAMVRLASGDQSASRSRQSAADRGLFDRSVKVVAGTCNHRQLPSLMVIC
jgi:DNA invertase Pin-like site-specific DNA recombinase